MRKKPDLYIRFFNEFSITSPNFEYAPSMHNSTQLTLLISYLVANHGMKVPKDTLMQMLWPDVQDKTPVGALRNLVYRARKELAPLYPDKDIEFIKFTQDAYYWNTDLYCKIDIVDFENYRKAAFNEPEYDKQYKILTRMHRLYSGEFLSNHKDIHWVHNLCTYYRDMYIDCVMNMCGYLYSVKHYKELISLCDKTIIMYPHEEIFYRYKLLGYLGLNMPLPAFEFYQTTVNFFSKQYGTDITSTFSDIYQDILSMLPEKSLNLDNFDKYVLTDTIPDKAYYCNFHVFKSLCQLNSHFDEIEHFIPYICIINLISVRETSMLNNGMKFLHKTLTSVLKKEDIFTKSSLNQYLILTSNTDESSVQNLKEKLIRIFNSYTSDFALQIESRRL